MTRLKIENDVSTNDVSTNDVSNNDVNIESDNDGKFIKYISKNNMKHSKNSYTSLGL